MLVSRDTLSTVDGRVKLDIQNAIRPMRLGNEHGADFGPVQAELYNRTLLDYLLLDPELIAQCPRSQ